jgi:hypothetical protein
LRLAVAIGGLGLLLGCAPQPMTVERATDICRDEAGLADGIGGTVGIGIGSTGGTAEASLTLTNRLLNPQTEEEFMADCVARVMAGQPAPPTIGITIGGSL